MSFILLCEHKHVFIALWGPWEGYCTYRGENPGPCKVFRHFKCGFSVRLQLWLRKTCQLDVLTTYEYLTRVCVCVSVMLSYPGVPDPLSGARSSISI